MSPAPTAGPEAAARVRIDAALVAAGWVVQDWERVNLPAARGVAVREVPLAKGHGDADYLLFLDGQAVGVLEAKKAGDTLTGVEAQAEKYATGLPTALRVPVRPLPFNYLSNGHQTLFFNLSLPTLQREPRSMTIRRRTRNRWGASSGRAPSKLSAHAAEVASTCAAGRASP